MTLSEVEETIIRQAKAENPIMTKGKWRIWSISFEGKSVDVFLANKVNRISTNMHLVLGKEENNWLSEVEKAIIRRAKAENPIMTKGKWRIYRISFLGKRLDVLLAHIKNNHETGLKMVVEKEEEINPRKFIAKKSLYSYFDEESYVDLSPKEYAKAEGYSVSYAKECLEYTLRKGTRLTLIKNNSGSFIWCPYGLATMDGRLAVFLESKEGINSDWFEEVAQ